MTLEQGRWRSRLSAIAAHVNRAGRKRGGQEQPPYAKGGWRMLAYDAGAHEKWRWRLGPWGEPGGEPWGQPWGESCAHQNTIFHYSFLFEVLKRYPDHSYHQGHSWGLRGPTPGDFVFHQGECSTSNQFCCLNSLGAGQPPCHRRERKRNPKCNALRRELCAIACDRTCPFVLACRLQVRDCGGLRPPLVQRMSWTWRPAGPPFPAMPND